MASHHKRLRRPRRPQLAAASLLAAVTLAALAASTNLYTPPRFDGAGYSVLALSLLTGQGYRSIEHPDRPVNAHYPPGYPVALAALWKLTGPSAPSAHLFSAACTLAATLLTWRWFRHLYPGRTALVLGLALALNWRWVRDGAVIRSEPLYQLFTALALLATCLTRRSATRHGGGLLGLAAGAAMLTRHVALPLAVACSLDLWLARRKKTALIAMALALLLFLPWLFWLATHRQASQLGLFSSNVLTTTLPDQALFYARRIPDQLTGPFVEVGTVFKPSWSLPMTVWAFAASSVIVCGWFLAARNPRRRLAALVPLATFPLLLSWPYTEAGRFLIPLLPFLLVGAVEGLARLTRLATSKRPHFAAAWLVLLAGLPYAVYSIATDRAGAEARTQARFEAACQWIADNAEKPGPLLTRYPGDVFWLTGRQAMAVPDSATPQSITRLVERYQVAYLLIEGSRFARSGDDPLAQFVASQPDRFPIIWGDADSVAVHEALEGPLSPPPVP